MKSRPRPHPESQTPAVRTQPAAGRAACPAGAAQRRAPPGGARLRTRVLAPASRLRPPPPREPPRSLGVSAEGRLSRVLLLCVPPRSGLRPSRVFPRVAPRIPLGARSAGALGGGGGRCVPRGPLSWPPGVLCPGHPGVLCPGHPGVLCPGPPGSSVLVTRGSSVLATGRPLSWSSGVLCPGHPGSSVLATHLAAS